MTHSDDSVVKEFIRNFLHSLCLKEVTTLNLGKDPWLRGLQAVAKYLEDNIKDRADNDLAHMVYLSLFHSRDIGCCLYGALNAELSVTTKVKLEFFQGKGAIYDFSAYTDAAWQYGTYSVVNLADKLAEVFAKAYASSSDSC